MDTITIGGKRKKVFWPHGERAPLAGRGGVDQASPVNNRDKRPDARVATPHCVTFRLPIRRIFARSANV